MKKIFTALLICLIVPFVFFACQGEPAKLSTPSALTCDDGVVSFVSVPNAQYYAFTLNDLEFNVTANNYNNKLSFKTEGKITYINYNLSGLLTLGESYTLTVTAKASGSKDSNSAECSFVYKKTLSAPTGVYVHNKVLYWEDVQYAESYTVKIENPQGEETEITTSSNKLDFNSALIQAGEYKFSVLAEGDTSKFKPSAPSQTVTYFNTLTLTAPTITDVQNNGRLLVYVLPILNANALTVRVNNYQQTKELNALSSFVTQNAESWIIDLNDFFNTTFNEPKQYNISVQANYLSEEEHPLYFSSLFSEEHVFNYTITLSAPTISLTRQPAGFILNITSSETLAIKYKIFLTMPEETLEIELALGTTSYPLEANFVSVYVQAIGLGNVLTSPNSNTLTNPNV